jgi:tetratricopeptide (TPR) repeat protein
MKSSIIIIMTMAFWLSGTAVAQSGDWQMHYVRALASMGEGDFEAAAVAFEDAIGCEPSPQAGAIDYLPYIYLAAARYELGQVEKARSALTQSKQYGIASRTEDGRNMIQNYSGLIKDEPVDHAVAQDVIDFRDYERKEFTLSDMEVEAVRDEVLRRCALSTDVAGNKLPWYFHYLFGQGLMEAGDAQRALDSYVLGANLREDSRRNKRMYGMWYIDYIPYYKIALAHAKLGNWKNARDAMELSSVFGEFTPRDGDFEAYSQLEELIARQIDDGGS